MKKQLLILLFCLGAGVNLSAQNADSTFSKFYAEYLKPTYNVPVLPKVLPAPDEPGKFEQQLILQERIFQHERDMEYLRAADQRILFYDYIIFGGNTGNYTFNIR